MCFAVGAGMLRSLLRIHVIADHSEREYVLATGMAESVINLRKDERHQDYGDNTCYSCCVCRLLFCLILGERLLFNPLFVMRYGSKRSYQELFG